MRIQSLLVLQCLLFCCLTGQAQNVGVNINNPAFTLDVRSTDDTSSGGELQLSTPSQTNFLRLFGGRLGDPNPFMAFHDMDTFHLVSTSADFSTYERKMTVYPSGEIGIGTDKPDGSLHVVGGSSIPFPTLRLTDTLDNFARIKMETTLGGDRFWDIAASSTPGFSLLNFYFQNDTAAQNLFSIQETSGAIVQRSFTNNSLHFFYNNAGQQGYHGFLGDNYYIYNTAYDGDLRFHTRGFARMIIDTLGYVGIRNISPRAELDISTYSTDDGSSLYMGNQDDSHFLRMFSGRQNLTTPLIYWKHGDVMQLGMANADDSGYTPFLSFDGKTIGVHNTGGSIFIGENAGAADNGDDNHNIAIGNDAMRDHRHGQFNIAIGRVALRFDTTGIQNIAIGDGSMYSSKYSFYNTAIGQSALSSAINVSSNTAVGYLALRQLVSGSGNTALGNWAMSGDTLGSNNTVVGVNAMSYAATGSNNVAVGAKAMRLAHGVNNTVLGFEAGEGDSTFFSGNVLLGYQAGKNITENNRLFIENSDSNSPLIYGEFDNNLLRVNGLHEVTGDLKVGDAFVVDESLERLGIGTQAPTVELHVADTDGFSYITTESGAGLDAILQLTDDASQGADHQWTMRRDGSDGGKLQWRHSNTHAMTLTPGGKLGIGGGGASPDYHLDVTGTINANKNVASGVAMRVDGKEALWSDGTKFSWGFGDASVTHNQFEKPISVGVGSGAVPGYTLEVKGTAGKPGGGSWANSSDRRLKQNIDTYTDGLDQVMQIEPVTFHYNDKSGYNTDPQYVGVIAQELQEITPYMVSENDKGYLDVDNSAMTYLLINAVQELSSLNEHLSDQLGTLTTRNRRLSHTVTDQQLQIENLQTQLDKTNTLFEALATRLADIESSTINNQ